MWSGNAYDCGFSLTHNSAAALGTHLFEWTDILQKSLNITYNLFTNVLYATCGLRQFYSCIVLQHAHFNLYFCSGLHQPCACNHHIAERRWDYSRGVELFACCLIPAHLMVELWLLVYVLLNSIWGKMWFEAMNENHVCIKERLVSLSSGLILFVKNIMQQV